MEYKVFYEISGKIFVFSDITLEIKFKKEIEEELLLVLQVLF